MERTRPSVLRLVAVTLVTLPMVTSPGCVSLGLGTPHYVSPAADPDAGRSVEAPLSQHELDPRNVAPRVRAVLDREQLSLQDLLELATLRNREIAAARSAWQAAGGRKWQSELYPNPTLSLESEEVPVRDFAVEDGVSTVALTQPIVLGGRLSSGVAAAEADRRALAFATQGLIWRVQGDVCGAHAELLYAREAVALHDELLVVARRTLEVAGARFEARASPESEVIKAELEVRELELGQQRLLAKQRAVAERLVALLGGLVLEPDRIAGALPQEAPELDLAVLQAAVAEGHPDVEAARQRGEAAQRRMEQARAERVPDVDLRVAYGRDGAADQDIVEAGLSVPLPLFQRNQGRILEARHLAIQSRTEAEARGQRLRADLAAAHAAYVAARSAFLVFSQRMAPAAERALDQAREGYQAGRVGILDLLDAQRTYTRTRLSRLEALRDLHLARAELWSVVGPEPMTEGR